MVYTLVAPIQNEYKQGKFYQTPKESAIISDIVVYLWPKNGAMICIIDPKTEKMAVYRSLIEACKWDGRLKYQTLKEKKLSLKGNKYKNLMIYRVKYYRD